MFGKAERKTHPKRLTAWRFIQLLKPVLQIWKNKNKCCHFDNFSLSISLIMPLHNWGVVTSQKSG
jgi:hypothetical protein